MVGLLDGGLAASFSAVFGAYFLDGTLHRQTRTETKGGDVILSADADEPIKVQIDQVSEAMRQAAGYTEKQQRLIVLQAGVSSAPTTANQITAGGQRWAIAAVEADPANTHWIIRGERA